MQSGMKIQGNGTEASFSVSHVVSHELVIHTNRHDSKVQYLLAVGGGMRIFRGTGKEAAYQPLSQYAVFT